MGGYYCVFIKLLVKFLLKSFPKKNIKLLNNQDLFCFNFKMWPIIALIIFAAIIALLYVSGLLVPVALFIGAGVVAILFYKFFIHKFDPYEAAIIYRFGRFNRVSPSGWAIVIPVIEKIGQVVDLREQQESIDIPVISKEGLNIKFNGVVQYYINNAMKAVLNIKNYRNALLNLIRSRIRDLAAEFTFTELLINVEDIAKAMKEQLLPAIDNWGVTLTTFEIEKMQPPAEVMDAFKGVKVAQEKLEAKKFVAEARRIVTAALGSGTKTFDDKTITYLYVKALENMKSAKMMVPAEFLDVVKPGNSNLAKSMIAGTTFNKALNAIEDEVVKHASMGKNVIKSKLEKIEHKHENNEVVAADMASDGEIDSNIDENS